MSLILRAAENDEPLPKDAKALLADLKAAGETYSAKHLEQSIKNW